MDRFVLGLSVNVSAMFRDPGFFRAMRTHVFPLLRTWPCLRIWQAGCSTGEEVYSVAIMLAEDGLPRRCRDLRHRHQRDRAEKARRELFPLELMQRCTRELIQAGGTRSFSEYYTAGTITRSSRRLLREHVVFATAHLVTDGPFNEFNLILCRNVLIYFNRTLQDRVHRLLYDTASPPAACSVWGPRKNAVAHGVRGSLRATGGAALASTAGWADERASSRGTAKSSPDGVSCAAYAARSARIYHHGRHHLRAGGERRRLDAARATHRVRSIS